MNICASQITPVVAVILKLGCRIKSIAINPNVIMAIVKPGNLLSEFFLVNIHAMNIEKNGFNNSEG